MKNTIKTLVGVAFVAMSLCLTSCSKDPEDLIIGSWNATKVEVSTTSSATSTAITHTNTPEAGESVVWTFKEDKTFTATQTEDGNSVTYSGTYTVTDEALAITRDNETVTFNIDNLDKEELVISRSESYTEEGLTVSETSKIYFEKQ